MVVITLGAFFTPMQDEISSTHFFPLGFFAHITRPAFIHLRVRILI